MTVFIFLGPSLPLPRARALLPSAHFEAPAAMGDVYRLARTQARPGDCIAIVDGLFERVPAVWHKEILYALSRGIHVYGAASMGALRAAELHAFGMRGIGRIFEAYRSGALEDDDEVAVVHADAGQDHRPLSTSMAGLRFALEDAVAAGRIEAHLAAELTGFCKRQHYRRRSFAGLIAYAGSIGASKPVLSTLRQASLADDAKTADALALLEHLRNHAETAQAAPFRAGFILEQTRYWQALVQSQAAGMDPQRRSHGRQAGATATASNRTGRTATDPAAIGTDAIASYLRAADPHRDAVLRHALLLQLADIATGASPPTAAELEAALHGIARRCRLADDAQVAKWRRQQQVTPEDWARMLRFEAYCLTGIRNNGRSLDPYVVLALKLAGRYDAVADAVAHCRKALLRRGLHQPGLDDVGIAPEAFERWITARVGALRPTPEQCARDLGLGHLRDLVSELVAAYLAESDAVARQ